MKPTGSVAATGEQYPEQLGSNWSLCQSRLGCQQIDLGGDLDLGPRVRWSFRPALLGPTGAHWLDDPPDVTCKDRTSQHAADGPRLSCKHQVGD
jgi:hypothetical protein